MSGYAVAADVAWLEVPDAHEPSAVAARVPDGPPLALHGPSAVIWLCAVDGGDADAITDRVADATGEHPDTVAPAVHGFLTELVSRGLLTETHG
ncbi:MAG: hypothetical protein QOH37_3191 [Nocardioidaceae bacterium]|nr:hypothetical protein [Nocardioidaceae bacterium]